MCKRFVSIMIFVFVIYFSSSVFAGSVELVNGDKITGKLSKMSDGKLYLDSELAGCILIPIKNIKTMSSDEIIEMHFSNGTVLKQAVSASDKPGWVKISGDTNIDSQEVALSRLDVINPPSKEHPRWKGNLSAGLTYTSGNTNTESYGINLALSKETEKDKTSFTADIFKEKVAVDESSEKVTTEDWSKLRGKYDYYYSEKSFLFGEVRYEQDKIALLDRRVILGGGWGYQFIKSDPENLSVELGLSNVYEDYNDNTASSSKFSAIMGYHYDKKFNDVLSFIHDTSFFPNIEDTSDYYMTTSAEIRSKINTRMYTNFKILYDYDTTPAASRKKADVKYMFGIGMEF